jgi:hypothetical protein
MPQKFEMKKTEFFHFLNLEFFIFEIWNENFCLIFFKKLAISPNGNEKTIEMKKSYISFMPPR